MTSSLSLSLSLSLSSMIQQSLLSLLITILSIQSLLVEGKYTHTQSFCLYSLQLFSSLGQDFSVSPATFPASEGDGDYSIRFMTNDTSIDELTVTISTNINNTAINGSG